VRQASDAFVSACVTALQAWENDFGFDRQEPRHHPFGVVVDYRKGALGIRVELELPECQVHLPILDYGDGTPRVTGSVIAYAAHQGDAAGETATWDLSGSETLEPILANYAGLLRRHTAGLLRAAITSSAMASDAHPPWHRTLERVREVPRFFTGGMQGQRYDSAPTQGSATILGLEGYLRPNHAPPDGFPNPRLLSLWCRGHEYCVCLRSDPLSAPVADALFGGGAPDVLLQALFTHQAVSAPLWRPFAPVLLARRAVIVVNTPDGRWDQAYRWGWPIAPPRRRTGAVPDLGFLVAAKLTRDWFPALPFDEGELRAVVREALVPTELLAEPSTAALGGSWAQLWRPPAPPRARVL
jgi:hypothetical protein